MHVYMGHDGICAAVFRSVLDLYYINQGKQVLSWGRRDQLSHSSRLLERQRQGLGEGGLFLAFKGC